MFVKLSTFWELDGKPFNIRKEHIYNRDFRQTYTFDGSQDDVDMSKFQTEVMFSSVDFLIDLLKKCSYKDNKFNNPNHDVSKTFINKYAYVSTKIST